MAVYESAEHTPVTLGKTKIEIVESFSYLGSFFRDCKPNCTLDVQKTIQRSRKALAVEKMTLCHLSKIRPHRNIDQQRAASTASLGCSISHVSLHLHSRQLHSPGRADLMNHVGSTSIRLGSDHPSHNRLHTHQEVQHSNVRCPPKEAKDLPS